MNDVRTFRAATMNDALDLVRRELGTEAVILQTRQILHRRFLPWSKRRQEVEITAGQDVNVRNPARRPPTQPDVRAPGRPQRPPAQPSAKRPPAAAPTRKTVSAPGVTFERTTTDGQVANLNATLKQVAVAPATAPTNRSAPQTAALPPEFANKLDSIQQMLQELGRSGLSAGRSDVPAELFEIYTKLIDAEVEDDIARELVSRLKESATPMQLQDALGVQALLTALVEKEIRCSAPIAPQPGQRKVVALVGATGVGKTTTIAKLAANFRLRDGVKMGLVTVDTYRIAAVEQLRTYADIIDLPMKVVTSPPEMRRALDELVGLDLILIDTAGRSPRDELQIQELKSLLSEAHVDEVHLVMNMTASAKTLEATAEKFANAGTTSLIMTKLDEAAGMGTLLSVARKVSLPVSYLTTGQDVPADIEPANPSRIARLILGREKLSN
ncbi:MAG: flagellar biosynthesis protein FlhF [Planctomycetaceae bacterium]